MNQLFPQFPNVLTGLSGAADGNMILPRQGPDTEHAAENRERFLATLGLRPNQLASARLHHRTHVDVVTEHDGGRMFMEADGLVTNVPGLALSVTGADCPPIFFYNPARQAIGIAHAGWRGIAAGIPAAVIRKMTEAFNTDPDELYVAIGPGIGPCHYEVHDDMANQFSAFPQTIEQRERKTFLDLKAVAREQLTASGVLPHNIKVDQTCTYDDTRYFSSRRDRINPVKAGMAVIWQKKKAGRLN